MPDPAPEPDQDHVNRIHVSSPPSPMSSSVTNSVYMNVPKHPEYVNFTDSKHQYVNVPDTVSQHSNRRKIFGFYICCVADIIVTSSSYIPLFLEPLPKPRVASSSGHSQQLTGDQVSGSGDHGVHPTQTIAGKDIKTQGRGKRPVPLPRRLSSISSPSQSPSSSKSSSPRQPAPSTPSTPSPSPMSFSSGSPAHFFSKSRESSVKKSNVTSVTSSPRRKAQGVDIPTPTANFKSYRRVPGQNTSSSSASEASQKVSKPEEGRGSQRNLKFPPTRQKQPAPVPSQSKLKSVTRLSFEGQMPISRADSGLGHTSVSSSDSVRLSSVSSMESASNLGSASPVRILVKQDPNKGAYQSKYHE